MSFTNKVILVTGGGAGIGAATAIKFVKEGASVAIVDWNKKKLDEVTAKCEQLGIKPLEINADLTNDEDLKRIMKNTIERFGQLDVLVNNAGMFGTTNIFDPDAMEAFDNALKLNLRPAVYLTHLAAPHLVKTKGNIVNISSVAALSSSEECSFPYCAAKAALSHFTRRVAVELAPKGVRANVVIPGPVDTDILKNAFNYDEKQNREIWEAAAVNTTALKKIAQPDELADLIVFLASEKAKSVTGSSYVMDNGYLLN